MHFIAIIFDEELSNVKLLNSKFSCLNISAIINSFDLISQSHDDFFEFSLYPLYVHLFSHKDKLLLINSSFLSFNIISVPFSVVYVKHSFV